MKYERLKRVRLIVAILGLALLLPLGARPARAQEAGQINVQGTVLSVQGEPLGGFRVVFRLAAGTDVRLTEPTSVEGEYAVLLPAGASYEIVAVIAPRGMRVALDPVPVEVRPGARRNLMVDISELPDPDRGRPAFPGADRLFLSFAEDTALPDRYYAEAQLEVSDLPQGDLMVLRAVGAAQFESIPQVEFGARVGYADLDPASGSGGGSGATDLDLWAKLQVGPKWMRQGELAFGGLVTLPTGDEATGQSFDALRSKLFAAMRWRFESVVLAASVGVRFNESGTLGDTVLDGQTAGSASIAVIAPLGERVALVGEAVYEGERFAGSDPDARLLGGVNWNLARMGMLRFAVAMGLADGAPDSQILAAYAFSF
jgi:hypothetical protein